MIYARKIYSLFGGTMAKKNKTRFALLGMLSFSPMSGYDIKKCISHSIGYFWNENYGHIYTILKRLHEEECIDKETEKNKGKPDRIVYTITPKGKNELNEWLNQPVDDMKFRNELLLKLFFSQKIPIDETINKLQTEYEKSAKLLSEYSEVQKHILEDNDDPYVKQLWLLTLNFGKAYSEMTQKWCTDSIDSLNKLNSSNDK